MCFSFSRSMRGPKTVSAFFLLMALLFSDPRGTAADEPALPVKITANDAHLRYTGRWEAGEGRRCSWPGCSVQMKTTASAINARLEGKGTQLQVLVDGKPTAIVKLTEGQATYPLVAGLDGKTHMIELFKRTETFIGTLTVLGFDLSAGATLLAPDAAPKRRIEFVGDSITCGYGNEAPDAQHHFDPATENNYLAYGALAARALGADYHCEAWSGGWVMDRGVTIIPRLFPRTLPERASSAWDFTQWIPQVVVIDLGTNDFSPGLPDEAEWVAQYVAFADTIHRAYPAVYLFLATGPMLGDDRAIPLRAYVRKVVAQLKAKGFAKVEPIEFATQDIAKNGVGADNHPSLATHREMADAVVQAVRTKLAW